MRVTFECDQSQDERDRKQLYRLVRELGCTERVQYEHRLATAEPLLAVPDAIGWAYARGGDFRKRARSLIVEVIDVWLRTCVRPERHDRPDGSRAFDFPRLLPRARITIPEHEHAVQRRCASA